MLIPFPIVLTELLNKFLGPTPKFKKGDTVQNSAGDEMMVVQWVKIFKRSMVMYYCKWYDPNTRSTRSNIFREEQLKQFDWIQHNRATQA